MTEPSINEDIEWLVDTEERLKSMNERYRKKVPENPRPWEPMQMAYGYTGQAISGCDRAIRYLQRAVKEGA